MWYISKTFRFEAGHRVWKQNLSCSRGSSLGSDCVENKCINLHGHSYEIEVVLSSKVLDNQDMVMDFHHLKSALKPLIDQFDHSFIIDKNDPLFEAFSKLNQEYGLKLTIVDFCPTAEALARYIYNYLKDKFEKASLLKEVSIYKVVVWETKTSKAEYIGEGV